MSSVFDVPQQLALAISLALAPAGPGSLPGDLPAVVSPAQTGARQVPVARRSRLSAKPRIDFRFTEQTWLRAIKEAVREPEIRRLSKRVFKTSSGRYYVPIAAERRYILGLRQQPTVAFRVAYDHARKNIARLAPLIGRAPSAAELYVAQLIGASRAARLIELAERLPQGVAAASMTAAAFDHPKLFFFGRRPATAGEIHARARRGFGRSRVGGSAARRPTGSGTKRAPAVAGFASLDWAAQ